MSSRRHSGVWIVLPLALLVLAAIAPAVWPKPRRPSPPREEPPAIPMARREQAITREVGQGRLARAWEEAARRMTAPPSRPRDLFAGLGPAPDYVAFGLALFGALRDRPDLVGDAMDGFFTAGDPLLLFQAARAIGPFLRGAAMDAWLSRLAAAGDAHRLHGLYALLGSDDPRAVGFLADRFEADASEGVRATAAFALGEVVELLPPARFERVRSGAWAALAAPVSEALKAEALDLLAATRLSEADAEAVGRAYDGAATSELKVAVLRALCTGGAPPAAIRATLARMAQDAALPDEVRRFAHGALASLP